MIDPQGRKPLHTFRESLSDLWLPHRNAPRELYDGQEYLPASGTELYPEQLYSSHQRAEHVQLPRNRPYLPLSAFYVGAWHIPPKNYILSYQLKVAGQLVTNSDLPIREIASACGFSSSASFAQQFYRTYGRSPRKFRNIDDSAQTTWSQTEDCHRPVQDPNL